MSKEASHDEGYTETTVFTFKVKASPAAIQRLRNAVEEGAFTKIPLEMPDGTKCHLEIDQIEIIPVSRRAGRQTSWKNRDVDKAKEPRDPGNLAR